MKLSLAISGVTHQRSLLNGDQTVPGVELTAAATGVDHAERYKRMCRKLEYDICELSLMSYFLAREFGIPISAIPVVPQHQFHHGDFVKNSEKGINDAADLVGRRVGTRTWTVTPGVFDRGILMHEFGVDLEKVTWVKSEPEHVEQIERRLPANVQWQRGALSLFDALRRGDLDAGIAGASSTQADQGPIVPLFPDAAALDKREYETAGIVPAFTVIVIRSQLLEAHPWLGEALYEAFVQARRWGLQPDPTVVAVAADDPVPIGLDANRASFENLFRLGHEQGILRVARDIDDLFLNVS